MDDSKRAGFRDERRRSPLSAARESHPTVPGAHLGPPAALVAGLCIIATEWLVAAPRTALGPTLYGSLFIGFLVIARAYERLTSLAVAFAVVALARLVTLTAPQAGFDPILNLYVIHVLILLSVVATLRVLGYRVLGAMSVHLAWSLPLLLLVGAALGAGSYLLLEPPPLDLTDRFRTVTAGVGLVVSGASIELLFRNLLLTAVVAVVGEWRGLLLTSAAYAVLFLGWGPWAVMAAGFATGLAYGALALRLRSPLAAVTAHVGANLALFGLMPYLLG